MLGVVLFGAAPASVPPELIAYASALRGFDPALDDRRALGLAERVIAEADAAGIDARLVVALVAVESSWDPRAVSPAGARGLGQLMPGTAAGLGVDPDDAEANLHGTVVHLRGLLARYGALSAQERYVRAIAAYNAGAGAVDRYGGVPPYRETRLYVRRVIGLWRRLCGVEEVGDGAFTVDGGTRLGEELAGVHRVGERIGADVVRRGRFGEHRIVDARRRGRLGDVGGAFHLADERL